MLLFWEKKKSANFYFSYFKFTIAQQAGRLSHNSCSRLSYPLKWMGTLTKQRCKHSKICHHINEKRAMSPTVMVSMNLQPFNIKIWAVFIYSKYRMSFEKDMSKKQTAHSTYSPFHLYPELPLFFVQEKPIQYGPMSVNDKAKKHCINLFLL